MRRPVPGALAAYCLLAASVVFVAAALAGAIWLTGQGAIWLGHPLPQPLL